MNPTCEHPGCEETDDLTECYYPDNETSDKPDAWYCAEHAPEHGFCYICGWFHAGIESFDFPSWHGVIPGLCYDCSESLRVELGEYDDDEWDELSECYFDEGEF